MKKQTTQILAVLAIIVIAAVAFGYIDISQWTGQVTPTTPTTPGVTPPAVPDESFRAGVAHWKIWDALTKTTTDAGDTAYVDIIVADANGVFDPLNPAEETEFDASPDTGSTVYSSGEDLVIAVTSDNDLTGGYETYPRWFYIKNLDHMVAIRSFNIYDPISAITQQKSGNTYTFTVNEAMLGDTVGTIKWVEGTTPYWDFGTFPIYHRVAKDYLLYQTVHNGVVGASLSDGATFIDTDAEITANFTLTSDIETIYLELRGEAANVAFGLPTLAVSSSGQIKQYEAVLIFGTAATEIDTVTLMNDGWLPMSKPALDEAVFYYVIDPRPKSQGGDGAIPDLGGTISITVPIVINDAALTASTEYEFETWVLDWQNIDNVAIGSTTVTLPSNNGFITDQGCDTIVMPLALTLSSGAVATPCLMGHFTTNA